MIATFFVLLFFALFGNARIGAFIVNRVVFGSREEHGAMKWLLRLVPPALLALTPLYWIAWTRVADPRLDAAGAIAWAWLLVTAGIGIYWVLDRAFHNWSGETVAGTETLDPEVIRLRKAHVPFLWLRNLGAHNDLYDLEITRHRVAVPDLPAPFERYRIAFLTDTHVASFMRRGYYREVVAQVRRADPDLVLLGGDFVSFRRHIPLMAELLLTGLDARDGVWAVLGNHDYWADADGVIAAMTAKGVRFIVNRSVQLERGGATLDLVGIDELYRGRPDPDAAFANADPTRPCVAVSHHPDIIPKLRNHRIDLLVCGHTHGGQIRFPFFGAVIVPSKHEGRYASGFHVEAGVRMYVSRGLGAIPPVRILCKPEVALFELVREESNWKQDVKSRK